MNEEKRPKTTDERIDALVESVELLAAMHRETETMQQGTQQQIHDLTVEVRRFRYWVEAVILNHESRLRALGKEPPEAEMPR